MQKKEGESDYLGKVQGDQPEAVAAIRGLLIAFAICSIPGWYLF